MKCLVYLKNIFINVWQLHYILIHFDGLGFEWSEDWSFSLAAVKLTNANIFEYFSTSSSLNDNDDGEKKLSDLTESSSAWYSGRLCASSKLMTVSWGYISACKALYWQHKLNVSTSLARPSLSTSFSFLVSSLIIWRSLSSRERFCNNLTKLLAIFVFKPF